MSCIIGVDGGGTKTALAAVFDDGRVRSALTEAVNYNFIGMDAALSHLSEGFRRLGVSQQEIDAVAIGDPSIDNQPVGEAALTFLHRVEAMFPQTPVFIRSDAYMALWSATHGTPGIAVIAGTGAMGFAEDEHGTVRVSGGWGRLTGDEGSAYGIGVAGIRSALRSADGIDAPTLLLDALLEDCGCHNPRALPERFYGDPPFDVASFAMRVAECADVGDEAAYAILTDAAEKLFELADTLAKACAFSGKTFPIGVSGSVLLKNRTVRAAFEKRIRAAYPFADVREPDISPEYAAVLYAKKQLKRKENPAFPDRKEHT